VYVRSNRKLGRTSYDEPLGRSLSLPFGWLYAFYQNAVVLGGISRERNIGLRDEAWAQAMAWPKQNHVGLLCLSLLALAILGNVATAFWVVPWLANRLLGIDNLFGTRGWWMVNTTFLASVVMLAWLAVDPLMKAFYVLRVFHGRARSTGEDLLEEFLGNVVLFGDLSRLQQLVLAAFGERQKRLERVFRLLGKHENPSERGTFVYPRIGETSQLAQIYRFEDSGPGRRRKGITFCC